MKDNNKKEYRVGYTTAQIKEESVPPPPPGFTSPFKSIQEWLLVICDTNKPEKLISEYSFILFENPENYLLGLSGQNTYQEEGYSSTKIDFKPTPMFYALPEEGYKNLTIEQARERVLKELIKFTHTKTFLDSFMAKAHSITVNFFGEIWPNQIINKL